MKLPIEITEELDSFPEVEVGAPVAGASAVVTCSPVVAGGAAVVA